MIDKDKQIYGWWTDLDLGLHCVCGTVFSIVDLDNEPTIITCPDCGQPWRMSLCIEMVDDETKAAE